MWQRANRCDTAFSTDAEQRFLYVGNRSQAKVMVFERKTLDRHHFYSVTGDRRQETSVRSIT